MLLTLALSGLTVAAVSGSTTSLRVSWTAPDNTGLPDITGYEVQYKLATASTWTDWTHSGTGTSTTISSLTASTPYHVRVRAINSHGPGPWTTARGTISMTPLAPTGLTMAPVSGSATSLRVTWTAPTNTGRPAITGYKLQYRKGTTGIWPIGPQNVSGTSTTISGLAASTVYQVRVRAVNADGDGPWAGPVSATTNAAVNNAPTFSSSAAVNVAEHSRAVVAVVASDTDSGDSITGYEISGGVDRLKFSITSPGGALTFKNAPDYENPTDAGGDNVYNVTVKATSGTGARVRTATQDIVVTVTNVAPPSAPTGLTVAAVAGSTTSLRVTWTAPANTRPAITGYDVQYRKGSTGLWSIGPQNVPGTTAVITGVKPGTAVTGLLDGTAYQVRALATNAEGDGPWSSPVSGITNTASNSAPVFSSNATASVPENTSTSTTLVTVVATDADSGDSITGYVITGGADAGRFLITSPGGALTFKWSPDYEKPADKGKDNIYNVTVRATGGTDRRARIATQDINVTVTNVAEKPGQITPTAAVGGAAQSLRVTWTAPDNKGPAITDYDVQYRQGASGAWTDWAHYGTGTSATITGLAASTNYQVQVRAANSDGDGPWSDPVSGMSSAAGSVTVSPTSLTITEGANKNIKGASETYTVRLDKQPTGNVTITPSSNNSDVRVSTARPDNKLVFTSGDYSTPQTVTVWGARDIDTTDDTATISHAVSGYGSAATPASVTVTVTDNFPAPATNRDPSFSADSATFTVNEDAAQGTVVGTVTATDPDTGDTLTYKLQAGGDYGKFAVNPTSGAITLSSALDYEQRKRYRFFVNVSDGKDRVSDTDTSVDDTIIAIVTVNNAEERGKVKISYVAPHTRPVTGFRVFSTLTDPDDTTSDGSGIKNAAWQWHRASSISNPPAESDWTLIGGATSATYTPVADDVGNYLRVTVTYTDGVGIADKESAVTGHRVAARNLAPRFTAESGGATLGFIQHLLQENKEYKATDVLFTKTAEDVTYGPVTYSLQGADAARFSVIASGKNAGAVSLASDTTFDYEAEDAQNSYAFEVVAIDKGDAATGQPARAAFLKVTVGVINVDEPGTITLAPSDVPEPAVEMTATLTDPDNLHYRVVNEVTTDELRFVNWRWGRCDTKEIGSCTAIHGATSAAYTPGDDDLGKFLLVRADYRDGEGSGKVAYLIIGPVGHLPEITSTPVVRGTVTGTYGAGETITVALEFPEAVTVTGTPRMPIQIGTNTRYAAYSSSASTATVLVFTYRVQSDDLDDNGISIQKDALELNGGTIKVGADNARLKHPALPTQAGHKVDGSHTTTACEKGSAVTETEKANNTALVADCDALLAAKSKLEGTGPGAPTLDWAADRPIGQWQGVSTLPGTPRRVRTLNLQEAGLKGAVPAELGGVSGLKNLYLSGNELTGAIPAGGTSSAPTGLAKLSNLETLRLQDNELEGAIPAALGNLASLKYLLLSGNDLTGAIPAGGTSSAPTGLAKLSNLTELRLDFNKLEGAIPAALGNLTVLIELDLRNNELTGAIPAGGTSSAPTGLAKLSNLKYLLLSGNGLTGGIPAGGTSSAPTGLAKLSNLDELRLDSNGLTGGIPAALGRLTKLTRLYLSNNPMLGSAIPAELNSLTNLTDLYLGNNGLTGSIPDLSALTKLRLLSLSGNKLTGTIPTTLGKLKQLGGLGLQGNQLTGSIPPDLGDLTRLRALRLEGNKLGYDAMGAELDSNAIPEEIGCLINLERLRLVGTPRTNRFTGTIPLAIQGFSLSNPTAAELQAALKLPWAAAVAGPSVCGPVVRLHFWKDQPYHETPVAYKRITITEDDTPFLDPLGIDLRYLAPNRAWITATVSKPVAANVTVTLSASPAASEEAGFTLDGATLTIPAGRTRTGRYDRVYLTALDNDKDAPDRVITVSGTLTLSAAVEDEVLAPSPIVAIIADDELTPQVRLRLDKFRLYENGDGFGPDASNGPATLSAELNGPVSSEDTTITVSTTAKPGTLTMNRTVLTIPAGKKMATQTITLTPVDNDVDGLDQEVVISAVAENAHGIDQPSRRWLTILDDDTQPGQATLRLNFSDTIDELNGTTQITASLDRDTNEAITVTVTAAPKNSSDGTGFFEFTAASPDSLVCDKDSTGCWGNASPWLAAVGNTADQPFRQVVLTVTVNGQINEMPVLVEGTDDNPDFIITIVGANPTVPADSALIPRDSSNNPLFTSGQSFRLLFVTSTWRDATSSDINVYNTFVQTQAATQPALAAMKDQFRALVSTASVDARDNTGTTGTGAPIYWLRGGKVADNYADLYDGSWDSNQAKFDNVGNTSSASTPIYHGSTADGTKHATRYAGANPAATSTAGDTNPLGATASKTNTEQHRFYALSPVITVE